jgi:monoamine oxidase
MASSTKTSVDVAIIGGGIAGLTAARRLHVTGHDVLVLEARHRLGGRIETSMEWGIPLDLGAAFLHGADAMNPLLPQLREAGVDLIDPEVDSAPVYMESGGRRLGDAEADRVDSLAAAASRKIHRLARSAAADQSLEEALTTIIAEVKTASPTVRRGVAHALAAEFEIVRGEDARSLALAHINADMQLPGGDLMLRQGYGQVIENLARDLPVRLGFAVDHISRDKTGVTIHSGAEQVHCRRAVIALPIGVMKSNAVAFDPPLPSGMRKALDRLGVGAVNKVLMRFPHRFWPDDGTIFGALEDDRATASEYYALNHLDGEAVLVWFVKGEDSRRLDRMEEEPFRQEAIARLIATFGPNTPPPTQILRTRWTTDPFTAGSHAVLAPGSDPADLDALSATIDGQLYFAGEATTSQFFGTTHGAYLTGMRAAAAIQKASAPQ